MEKMLDRQEPSTTTNRSGDQRDRARIIHSASFRRLQSKTQILGVGENDFYRTRLTHSMEVAQIGSGIVGVLSEADLEVEIKEVIPSFFQIEAICLAHDLGHPPFGHGGEVALNHYMRHHGGFEGNGQTLRIVSKLGEYSKKHGMNLMRRTMLGLLKYPVTHSVLENYTTKQAASPIENFSGKHWKTTNIKKSKPPKCIHDEEQDVLEWICDPFEKSDQKLFFSVKNQSGKHRKTIHKSFDTSIMELADDIAYGIHDFEDAVALGLITEKIWREYIEENPVCVPEGLQDFCLKELFSPKSNLRKRQISNLVDYFVTSVGVKTKENFEHPLLKFNAFLNEPAKQFLSFFKGMVSKIVIFCPEVQTLEFKGQQIVRSLFETIHDSPGRFLRKSTLEKMKTETKQRVIADYISGMSDAYATKLYQKLFSPSVGSIFDKL